MKYSNWALKKTINDQLNDNCEVLMNFFYSLLLLLLLLCHTHIHLSNSSAKNFASLPILHNPSSIHYGFSMEFFQYLQRMRFYPFFIVVAVPLTFRFFVFPILIFESVVLWRTPVSTYNFLLFRLIFCGLANYIGCMSMAVTGGPGDCIWCDMHCVVYVSAADRNYWLKKKLTVCSCNVLAKG